MFDSRLAEADLRRLRRRGPARATRDLLAALERADLPPEPTLIDIGGGVGAIHHQLLEHGFASAVQVDASDAYLEVAAAEAQRRGHAARVTFHRGDIRAVAGDLPEADVVTLDRVVCCDPDYVSLLGVAASRARRCIALTFPRPRRLIRAVVAMGNGWRRLAGLQFRAYVHPPERMSAVLAQHGFRRAWKGGTWIWAAELYERAA